MANELDLDGYASLAGVAWEDEGEIVFPLVHPRNPQENGWRYRTLKIRDLLACIAALPTEQHVALVAKLLEDYGKGDESPLLTNMRMQRDVMCEKLNEYIDKTKETMTTARTVRGPIYSIDLSDAALWRLARVTIGESEAEKHLCQCEVCSRGDGICTATASSLALEIAAMLEDFGRMFAADTFRDEPPRPGAKPHDYPKPDSGADVDNLIIALIEHLDCRTQCEAMATIAPRIVSALREAAGVREHLHEVQAMAEKHVSALSTELESAEKRLTEAEARIVKLRSAVEGFGLGGITRSDRARRVLEEDDALAKDPTHDR